MIFWSIWETIFETGARQTERAIQLNSYLKSYGVRSELKVFYAKQPSAMPISAEVRVHKKDLTKARSLLSDFQSGEWTR